MRFSLSLAILISLACHGQKSGVNRKPLLTDKYAGFYSFGKGAEIGRTGTILIYPETDSTILFNIEVNIGPPSYNMGELYGRLRLINDSGRFYKKFEFLENGCGFSVRFSKTKITIKTIGEEYDCPFGHGVFVDGVFKRQSSQIKEYFEDMEGKKIYFRKTTPEAYYQN